MTWTKPDFVEIILGMEVTMYVNTDAAVETAVKREQRTEEAIPVPDRETAS